MVFDKQTIQQLSQVIAEAIASRPDIAEKLVKAVKPVKKQRRNVREEMRGVLIRKAK